jgi:hypothetical protein
MLAVRGIAPRGGQIQPPIEQGIAYAAGIRRAHPRLAVVDLAQTATPLAGDSDRILPLLGKLRAIQQLPLIAWLSLPSMATA